MFPVKACESVCTQRALHGWSVLSGRLRLFRYMLRFSLKQLHFCFTSLAFTQVMCMQPESERAVTGSMRIKNRPKTRIRFSTLQNSCQPKNTEMTSATESFRIAFRVSDKQFVVRDATDTDVFAGTYRDVESWLDQRENTVSALRAEETMGESETDAAAAVLKATMLTQEMIDKALSTLR